MRKTGKEILESDVTSDDRHAWLAEATADELSEFLRWAIAKDSWALHGRDALNVVLAKENIKLQRAIRNLTISIFLLTIIMVFLGVVQVYPNLKTFWLRPIALWQCQRPQAQTTKPQIPPRCRIRKMTCLIKLRFSTINNPLTNKSTGWLITTSDACPWDWLVVGNDLWRGLARIYDKNSKTN